MIQSVHFTLDNATEAITAHISGSGFGSFPESVPFVGDSLAFVMEDSNEHWSAGYGVSPGAKVPPVGQGGMCTICDGYSSNVVADYKTWTDDRSR